MTTSKTRPRRQPIKVTHHKQKRPWASSIRLLFVWLLLVSGAIALLTRLYQLQVVLAPQLEQKSLAQQLTSLRPYTPRRAILDRENNILATDRLVYKIYVHPTIFNAPAPEIATKLAEVLKNYSKEQLLTKFQQQPTGILISRSVPESVATEIKSLRTDSGSPIAGVDLEQNYYRFYPHQETFADVIGYIDADRRPQAGIERSQDKLLSRPLSEFHLRRRGKGDRLPADLPPQSKKNDDLRLQLTLDMRLQRAAKEALAVQMEKYRAKRGGVIVMDVQDGSILALVCDPSYNPNKYYNYPVERYKNWTVSDLYEPGSTFKPINVAIALEAGVIQPNSQIDDPGKLEIDGWPIFNYDYHERGGHGKISITRILEVSSNIGMIKIMNRMAREDYYAKLQALEIDQSMLTDLPGSTKGQLKNRFEFTAREIEAATATFGQGLSLSPLKLVQLHGAIANGGKLVTPHVIRGFVDANGYLHHQPAYESKSVFSPTATAAVREMMTSVVENGSGKVSQIPGYWVAGKTGTAQKAISNGYHNTAKITSFVSIFPADQPRYVILAVVDEPQGDNTFGSTVAAPIVKSVIESLIAVESIPPSRPVVVEDENESAANEAD